MENQREHGSVMTMQTVLETKSKNLFQLLTNLRLSISASFSSRSFCNKRTTTTTKYILVKSKRISKQGYKDDKDGVFLSVF